MRFSVLAASLLAACAQAIQVTSPTKNEVVDLAAGFEVKWSTVSSDATKAHLFLVNMAGGSVPFSKDLGEIDLTKGSILVVEESAPNGEGYQFNVQSVSQHNTGILAQSQQFEVKSSPKKSTTTSADSSASASASKSTSASVSASQSAQTTLAPSVTGASNVTGTRTSPTASISTGAAAAPNQAVQGGSLLALVMGIVAIVA